MITKKPYKIIITLLIFIFVSAVIMQMTYKIKHEMTPEGRFENYRSYISDSVELWVKNRDNGYYTMGNVIDFYETPNKQGIRPMDQFPSIIYEEIKNALIVTFVELTSIKDPDRLKQIISDELDLKKNDIIKKLLNKNI